MGSSHRRHGTPLEINSAANRVETKLCEAYVSHALWTMRPPTQIFLEATDPKARTLPNGGLSIRRRRSSQTSPAPLAFAAGGGGAVEESGLEFGLGLMPIGFVRPTHTSLQYLGAATKSGWLQCRHRGLSCPG
jgi:hypothetical protein